MKPYKLIGAGLALAAASLLILAGCGSGGSSAAAAPSGTAANKTQGTSAAVTAGVITTQ